MTTKGQGRFRAVAVGDLVVDGVVDLTLQYTAPDRGFKQGGSIWIFSAFRQFSSQFRPYLAHGGVSVSSPTNSEWLTEKFDWGGGIRTLDLVPEVPEFLNALHVTCVAGGLDPGETVEIQLKTAPNGYKLPQNAIESFYFWAVEDPDGEIEFLQSREDRAGYYYFQPRATLPQIMRSNPLTIRPGAPKALRLASPSLSARQSYVRIHAEDEFGNPVEYQDGPVRLQSAVDQIQVDGLAERGTRAEIRLNDGIDRVRASAGSLEGEGGPIRVAEPVSHSRLYWGELHGMVFNQRPYREQFEWARDVACLDFSAGQLFSYLTCVGETWEEMKKVWDEFELPGEFISLPAVEYGTPPDGSHRIGFFPSTNNLPPLFCEVRRGAHDPLLMAKFSRETIYCRDYRALYDEVHKRGGIVHGHYHTRFYEAETLAEIYQKQQFDVDAEEEKINKHLRAGVRLGIVGGTDTHDSRPGNPFPEPGPARPGGLTGVWAEKLDRESILNALKNRRTYATTGARMIVEFEINGKPMGSTVEAGVLELSLRAIGTEKVARVELVEDGAATTIATPVNQEVNLNYRLGRVAVPQDQPQYYYLRLLQVDGNRAWTSPIWIEG